MHLVRMRPLHRAWHQLEVRVDTRCLDEKHVTDCANAMNDLLSHRSLSTSSGVLLYARNA